MDITGMISGLFGQMGDLLNQLLAVIMVALPNSPFQMITQNATVSRYLGYLNWFIPITFMLGVLQAWLIAVGIFYVWQLLLRWLKAIE